VRPPFFFWKDRISAEEEEWRRLCHTGDTRMQRWSNQELTSVNHSSDFLCPHCEAGSFEVIGVERHLGEQEEAQCALVMRCLICLGQFWHLAETESSSLQDLYPAPAVAAGKS